MSANTPLTDRHAKPAHTPSIPSMIYPRAHLAVAPTAACTWTPADCGTWRPGCDWSALYVFPVDGPAENGHRFCCYCGKPLTTAQTDTNEETKP